MISDTWAELAAILAPFAGRSLLDIGCGHGALARSLTRAGAAVTALDPGAEALAAARRAAPDALLVQGAAESLPFGEAAFDGAILLNSLHHVPGPAMEAALAEASRVIRPGGTLVVVEPLAEGPFFEAMRPLEDETAIRGRAQAVLAGWHGAALVAAKTYLRQEVFASAEAFMARIVAAEPERAARLEAVREAIERRFAQLGVPIEGGRRLDQPMRLHHFRPD